MAAITNPFLLGNYAPGAPTRSPHAHLEVTGRSPPELNGRYLRIGPNPYTMPDRRVPLVRRRRHGARRRARATGAPLVPQPLGPHAPSRRRARRARDAAGPTPPMYDCEQHQRLGHAGRIFVAHRRRRCPTSSRTSSTRSAAATSAARCRPGSPRTRSSIPSPASCTASPTRGPSRTIYHVIDPRPAGSCAANRSPLRGPTMIHDFALTRALRRRSSTSRSCSISTWRCAAADARTAGTTTTRARVGLDAPRRWRRRLRWFDVEPCYVFHPMNAYDDGDTRRLDVCGTRRCSTTAARRPERRRRAALDRWTVDTAAGKVREELRRRPQPGVPPGQRALLVSRHRYGYAVEPRTPTSRFDTARIIKHDMRRRHQRDARLRRRGRRERVRLRAADGATPPRTTAG